MTSDCNRLIAEALKENDAEKFSKNALISYRAEIPNIINMNLDRFEFLRFRSPKGIFISSILNDCKFEYSKPTFDSQNTEFNQCIFKHCEFTWKRFVNTQFNQCIFDSCYISDIPFSDMATIFPDNIFINTKFRLANSSNVLFDMTITLRR